MSNVLLSTQKGFVRELTLNRPERMNALNEELVGALHQELKELRFDDTTRVLVFKGAGGRAFCAGADLKERASMEEKRVQAFVSELRALFHVLFDFPKITIACLNGIALGGGLELALSCDLRYGASGIKLGLTETRLAIIPGAGGTQLLPRLIGTAKAKELIYKAAPITAEEAFRMGLLNHVSSLQELDAKIAEDAALITANGPIALNQAKKAINLGLEMSLEQGLEVEKLCYAQTIPTKDRLEGLQAFKEKRPPVYRGH